MMGPVLHHVGMVLRSGKESTKFMSDFRNLGFVLSDPDFERVEEFKCMCYLYGQLEIIVPDKGSKLDSWMDESITTLHHICLVVDDVRKHAGMLRDKGVPILSEEPVNGVAGLLVNFVHPMYMGMMVEIAEVRPTSTRNRVGGDSEWA